MNSKNEKVELLPAFLWTCPACGLDNFERTVVVEFSPEEMQELRRLHGIKNWRQGDFLTSPKDVTCFSCKADFEAEDFGTI